MIEDYEQELTSNPGDGQAFVATGFGGRPFDLGVAGVDPAVGEQLQFMWQVTQNFNNLTSATVDVVAADDAAGTNPVVVATSGAVVLANLTTVNSPVRRLGSVVNPTAIAKRWLLARVTVTGTAPTLGKVRVWIQKGAYVLPINKAAL